MVPIRAVVAISRLQNADGHTKKPASLPRREAALNHPRCRLLSGVKRTLNQCRVMYANDPKRTSARRLFAGAQQLKTGSLPKSFLIRLR
jgi:hypothetical protein